MAEEKKKNLWKQFYAFFPEIELPITLSEEYTGVFTKYNKPIPMDLIQSFILEQHLFLPEEEIDSDLEIEEYVPCFKLPKNKNYRAVVYWKASLLKYEYVIHTYDLKGKTITKHVIASTTSDGKKIRQIVATIDPDLEIYIMGGDADSDNFYDPEKSKAFSLEITPTGQIIHHFEEN
jgi:hypothetical protein